jgi:DNA topoisomerase-3
MILQQPVEREQMQKLLATGRTDLLTNFVSKKNRKFKAFLVKTPGGKVGFEFLPRAEKPGKPPAVKAAANEKPAALKPLKQAAAARPVRKAVAKKAPARPARKKR